MNSTVETNKGDIIITLKEITDLIDVRHNNSMKKVEKLALEPNFGSLLKMSSQYKSGKGRMESIETYGLTKKQAIAVGAKLNNNLLMKVIDRLEELEIEANKAPSLPTTYLEALQDLVSKEQKLLEQAPKVEAYNDLMYQDKYTYSDMTISEVGKALGWMPKKEFFPMIRNAGIIFHNTSQPKIKYIEEGWFKGLPLKDENYSTVVWRITIKGMEGMLKKFGRKGD